MSSADSLSDFHVQPVDYWRTCLDKAVDSDGNIVFHSHVGNSGDERELLIRRDHKRAMTNRARSRNEERGMGKEGGVGSQMPC